MKELENKIIGIDGGPYFRNIDGIGRYAFEVLNELARKNKKTIFIIVAFTDDRSITHHIPIAKNILVEYLPIPRRLYQYVFKYLYPMPVNLFLRKHIDAMVYFNFVNSPHLNGVSSLTVVHDLAYIDIPETVSRKNRHFLKQWVPWSLSKSTKLVAVSEFTKKRIQQEYGNKIGNMEISVISPGVSQLSSATKSQLRLVKSKYNLPANYMLFVGTVEPRKNLTTLLKALDLSEDSHPQLPPLVIVGAKGWNLDYELNELILRLTNKQKVITLGYVEDDDLNNIYTMASLFVFPSNYEGFGIPLVEAMKAGVAVTTSNKEPMATVVPSSAPLFNPDSSEEVLNSIDKLLNNEQLRKQVIEDGLIKARLFTWERSATLLTEELNKIFKRI